MGCSSAPRAVLCGSSLVHSVWVQMVYSGMGQSRWVWQELNPFPQLPLRLGPPIVNQQYQLRHKLFPTNTIKPLSSCQQSPPFLGPDAAGRHTQLLQPLDNRIRHLRRPADVCINVLRP